MQRMDTGMDTHVRPCSYVIAMHYPNSIVVAEPGVDTVALLCVYVG